MIRQSPRFSIRMAIGIFCSDTETGAVTPLGRGAEQILFGDDEYFSCFNCYISKELDGNAASMGRRNAKSTKIVAIPTPPPSM